MDVALLLQHFESTLSSYVGDDPLEPWERLVEHLEQRLPAGGADGMSLVFDALLQRFLNNERYANDVRYVNCCIKCVSSSSDPISLYSHIFSRGVGTRTAALYVAWAQQLERQGMNEQAGAVYQKAVENQAQPADTVLQEFRQFQSRTRVQGPAPAADRMPLQNSNLTNQPAAQNKVSASGPSKPPSNGMTMFVSSSETLVPPRGGRSSAGVLVVSEYTTDALVCEGSEFCFESVRAAKWFQKQEELQRGIRDNLAVGHFQISEGLFQWTDLVNSSDQPSAESSERPPLVERLSDWRFVGLRLHNYPEPVEEEPPPPLPVPADRSVLLQVAAALEDREHAVVRPPSSVSRPGGVFCQDTGAPLHSSSSGRLWNYNNTDQPVGPMTGAEENLYTSQGGATNLSHVTPNTSLGFVQATPSRALPSPTVNTREALGVIMDMFQAPTFLDEPFAHASMLHATEGEELHATEGEELHATEGEELHAISAAARPPANIPFTIFQDDNNKENGGAADPPVVEKSNPVRALCDITASKTGKPNDTPPDLPDESAMWGVSYDSLAACPNSTTDFAMSARCVSTPFPNKTFCSTNLYQDREGNTEGGEADEGAFVRRQANKLSPIIEQSPSEDNLSESAVPRLAPSCAQLGTIVGEEPASPSDCLTTSSVTMVQPPPPATLSFREASRAAGPGWEVYTSPEQPPKAAPPRPGGELCEVMQDADEPASPAPVHRRVFDEPMSPDCPLKPDWMTIGSPERPVQSDLDAFTSPRRPSRAGAMSPEPPAPCADVPMSPQQVQAPGGPDEPAALRLVPDPWDGELISHLLSTLTPTLTSHPSCVSWQFNMPNIMPRMTVSMGRASLQVDGVVGQGAFATVYQVTELATGDKMVLKVQKPANPWEFYINTQLDARLQPDARCLFSSLGSAHLFLDGSVLLGELHQYGTLLNAVNIYKTLSDKVMPVPLVMYFTVCILHTVEQLHAVHIVHADIKPDNFLLGERFLENRGLEVESGPHGLVLVDLGQSIDMALFPPGTAFTARCLTSGFQCTEMLSGKPWNYQTDYFGVAATVHCMLFGTYMQVTNDGGVWRTNGVFRRNPHSELWQDFFHTLLNVPRCHSPPSLRHLRERLTATLQHDYRNKLPTLRSRLLVLLLENRRGAPR